MPISEYSVSELNKEIIETINFTWVPTWWRNMSQPRAEHDTKVLLRWILFALIYVVVIRCSHLSTNSAVLAGSIGVVLGLVICVKPAANLLNMLLYERRALHQFPSTSAVILWLALNLLVLLVGWTVIFVGLQRFAEGVI
jgi:hypothetical protein